MNASPPQAFSSRDLSTADPRSAYQTTLQRAVSLSGMGLHSGQPVELRLEPAPAHSGIHFERIDLPGSPPIPATLASVCNTTRATTLRRGAAQVSVVEHLLAACALLKLDNLNVKLSGPELPIFDGSALPYYLTLRDEARLKTLHAPRTPWILETPLRLEQGNTLAYAEPAPHFSLEISLSLSPQHGGEHRFLFSHTLSPDEVERTASARTFGWLHEVEALHHAGLALGGSLSNAVVLTEEGVLNPEGLRCPDELVRHKTLDALGDLMLLSPHLQGRFAFHRAGHHMHITLARALEQAPHG